MPRLSEHYRTAFVTGASAGLGLAYAQMLLADGVRVWGTAREAGRLQGLAANPLFTPVALDLACPAEAESVYLRASEAAGGFDLLINNAGYGVYGVFQEVSFDLWQKQLNEMLGATARLNHAALARMLPSKRGCIVNVASLATDFPLPFMAGYNMVKAGLSALSESLMFEVRGTGVVVIDFRPGDFRTDFNRAVRQVDGPQSADGRLAKVWAVLEKNVDEGPAPERAAASLRRALLRRRSGIVRCGTFFQAHLAPFLVRFAPSWLRRRVASAYFGSL